MKMSAVVRLLSLGLGFSQSIYAQPLDASSMTAQQRKEAAPGDGSEPKRPAISPDVVQPLAGREGFSRDDAINRRIAAIERLREMLFETIKFNDERKKKIEGMFDDYLAGLIYGDFKPHLRPRQENLSTPQQLPELKKQMETAEKENDAANAESIKEKIYAAKIALEPNIIDEVEYFYEYVRAELTKEEQERFVPMMERLRLLRVAEVAPDNDFKHVLRASRDPLLGLSKEKSETLRAMLIEDMRTVPFPQRNDQRVMTELAQKSKPKILKELDSKQQEQLEKTIVMLARWQKEDVEIAKKTRERLKDRVVNSSTSQPATEKETSKSVPKED